MCLIHCDVRIRTARAGGSGVRRPPGHHKGNHQQELTGDRLRGEKDTAQRGTGGAGRVAQYTEPVAMVQSVCNHPAKIIALQKQSTDLQTQQFLPPECDHSTFEQPLGTLRHELEEGKSVPRTVGTDEDL